MRLPYGNFAFFDNSTWRGNRWDIRRFQYIHPHRRMWDNRRRAVDCPVVSVSRPIDPGRIVVMREHPAVVVEKIFEAVLAAPNLCKRQDFSDYPDPRPVASTRLERACPSAHDLGVRPVALHRAASRDWRSLTGFRNHVRPRRPIKMIPRRRCGVIRCGEKNPGVGRQLRAGNRFVEIRRAAREKKNIAGDLDVANPSAAADELGKQSARSG